MTENEPFVVEAETMQNCSVQVVDMYRIARDLVGVVIGFTEKRYAASVMGSPNGEHGSCKPADFGFNSSMSMLEQVEEQVKRLSAAEQEALRDWLENLLEDRLELKDEFKAEIKAGIKDVAEGRYRIRRP